ncbi:MAG: DnaJ domain-containing protein [Deltaproteobacteria bacterium]|nr:DnaJ domain-containing protein [Deltaproteobacteria bacterium]
MDSRGQDSRIILPEEQFLQSCRTLFGPEVRITPQFLGYLQPAGVKTAYRKLAMETHPDRAIHIGTEESILETRFKEVNRAYEQIVAYVREPERYILRLPPGSGGRAHRPATAPPAKPQPHFYQGPIPPRKIFIGQYLYYSGRISMQQMWGAVVWQKLRRPRLGDLARTLHWLTPVDIREILQQRNRGELFGEFALRTGLLSYYQLLVLLGRQKRLQPRIGNYFIEQKILLPEEIDAMVEALKEHNRQHWFKK